jgi:Tfp pilus assembly protein PilX
MNTALKIQAINYFKNMKPLHAGRALRNESGAALVIALLLMVTMITIIPVAMHMTSADLDRTDDFQDDRAAFFIADAGLQHAGSIYQDVQSNDIMRGIDGIFSDPNGSTPPTDWNGTGTEIDDNGLFTDDALGTPSTIEFVIDESTSVDATSKIDGATHKYTRVAFNGGDYKIRLWDNEDAIACPKDEGVSPAVSLCTSSNQDPLLDNDNEDWVDRDGMVHVESIGTTAEGDSVTLHGLIKRKNIQPSRIPAAVVLVGPKGTVYSVNNGFNVTGADSVGGAGWDIGAAGTPDPECSGKAGISIEGVGWTGITTPNYTDYDQTLTNNSDRDTCENGPPPSLVEDVCIALSNNARSNIIGVHEDGTSSPDLIINDPTFTAEDAAKMYKDIITDGKGYFKLPSPANPADLPTLGTQQDPVIVWAPGDLNLTPGPGPTGYGILVVDGNFNMAGNFIWNGLILIGTCPTCTGDLQGSGDLTVNGSVIIGNASADRSRSIFSGTADFQYSCKGIEIAASAIDDSYGVVTWNKVP